MNEIQAIKSDLYVLILNNIRNKVPYDIKKQLISEQLKKMKIQKLSEPLKGLKVDLYI
jgi:hypothetical protein